MASHLNWSIPILDDAMNRRARPSADAPAGELHSTGKHCRPPLFNNVVIGASHAIEFGPRNRVRSQSGG